MPDFTQRHLGNGIFSTLSILHMENRSSYLSNFPREHEAVLRLEGTGCVRSSNDAPGETHCKGFAGWKARNGVGETGLWSHCCPSGTGPFAGHFSSLTLVAHLSNVQIGPGARSEPQGRSIKIKMIKRPGAGTKEQRGKCQVWSGSNEHILTLTNSANNVLS